ncbi:MAG: translation initiation factor IF-2 [Clostridia bacterium]|nr:translation initiation factor IF-2 [Clostridia bacterium]
MSFLEKIRISDIAKDFGVPNKTVMTILTELGMPPKSPAKVLEPDELDRIFEVMTIRNQVDDIAAALAVTAAMAPAKEKEEPKAEPKAEEPVKTEAPVEEKPKVEEPKAEEPKAAQPVKPAAQPAPQPTQPKKESQPQPTRKPERRYVDSRGSNVDMSKYDERIDALVPERADKLVQGQGKQKIRRAPDKKNAVMGQKRRQEEQERMRRLQLEVQKKQPIKVSIPDEISVGELASRLMKTGAEVVKQLMKLGVMAGLSEIIDFDTASLVAMEFNAKIEHEVHLTIEERLIDDHEDKDEDLLPCDPVIVVMGHVDHGKTSLLDHVRKSHVAAGEAGGITQHIGAYQIKLGDRQITFLDTPGHAAFTSMRARGASVTDIAILVVAADDGIMPQTIEAINHAKAAEIPIVVAINKMDKPTANPDRIKQQLTEYGLVAEEWGGDTIICPISALTGDGIPNLLEMVLLVADMRELKANPDRTALGTVIEARLDKNRGSVATLLVQNGTLHAGDLVIAGKAVGHVRAMTDYAGRKITVAGPSTPVEITGLDEAPGAGDRFHVVTDERMARELVMERREAARNEAGGDMRKLSLQDLFAQIQEGNVKDLNIIIKADVQGSAEAVKASLEKLSNDEVRVRVIHTGVGGVNENDIMLASASNAIVVGFNIRPDGNARTIAAQKGIDIRTYRVIYECINEIEAAMKGMLAPKFKEEVLGSAEVRQVFKVSGVGAIAGCMVKDGKIARNAKARLVRDSVVIHEGEIASLKRFKDDAKEVASGYECGIGLENFNDIKEGDVIEAFIMVQI